jgi:transcriptional regulator with XRE-family HTH domain
MNENPMQHAKGFFAMELCWHMMRRGISVRDLACQLGYSPEQIRRITRGQIMPSRTLAEGLYRTLGIDPQLGAQKMHLERMRRRYGSAFWEFYNIPPKMERFCLILPYLTKAQRDAIHEQMEAQVEANKIIARRKNRTVNSKQSRQSRQSRHLGRRKRGRSRQFPRQLLASKQ